MKVLKLFLLAALAHALAGCASAPVAQISYDAPFEAVDTSKDNIISVDEFKKSFLKGTEAAFKDADADKDGIIYPDEWYQFRETKGYLNQ